MFSEHPLNARYPQIWAWVPSGDACFLHHCCSCRRTSEDLLSSLRADKGTRGDAVERKHVTAQADLFCF